MTKPKTLYQNGTVIFEQNFYFSFYLLHTLISCRYIDIYIYISVSSLGLDANYASLLLLLLAPRREISFKNSAGVVMAVLPYMTFLGLCNWECAHSWRF